MLNINLIVEIKRAAKELKFTIIALCNGRNALLYFKKAAVKQILASINLKYCLEGSSLALIFTYNSKKKR